LFFGLAYRFDNRFVLSLALSTLAGWFGVRLRYFDDVFCSSLRPQAVVYAVLFAAAWAGLHPLNIKKKFTETYHYIASIRMLTALCSGVFQTDASWLYLPALLAFAALAIALGVRYRRFAFVVYGIVYGYAALSIRLVRSLKLDSTGGLAYFVISASLVTVAM